MRPNSLRKRVWVATKLMRFAMWIAVRILHLYRVEVFDRHNMPRRGAALVASNHLSLVDPIFLGFVLRRNVAFFAMAELFRIPILRSMLAWFGQVPINRGDRGSAQEALNFGERVLQQNGVIGIYPEGRCSADGQLLPLKNGVYELAIRTGTCVVPVGVQGTQAVKPLKGGWRLFKKVTIRFGEPMYAASFDSQEDFLTSLAMYIQLLSKPA